MPEPKGPAPEQGAPEQGGELPKRFGKYLLAERIAQGGMAEIFKAKSYGVSGFEKTIVIKRILPSFCDDQEFIDMLIDEAKISACLQHANVVQIFDLGRLEGRYFIAMEYVRGVDLVEVLTRLRKAKARLPVELACFIMSEVLKGLDFAHRALGPDGEELRIIHRDVNPANILLSYQGEVKVGDFGIAKAERRDTETVGHGLKGKMGYLSPEQVSGLEIDARTDIFTAGITMWEILACQRMYGSGTELDILMAIREAEVPDLHKFAPEVDQALVHILGKALAKDPAQRFQTAGEFRDAVDDFLFDRAVKIDSSHLEGYLKQLFADRIKAEQERKKERAGEVTRVAPPRFWMRSPGQTAMGPLEIQEVSELIASGRANHSSEVLREGGQWHNIASVPELSVQLSKLPTPEESDPDAVADYQGMLMDASFTKLLYRLAIVKAEGRLVLTRPGVKKEIYMRKGFPEFVKSNLVSERLGDYLVAKKAITEDQRDEAIKIMKGFSGRLGDTLIGMGLLKPHELFELLSQQVLDKFFEVFGWTAGNYRFYSGQTYEAEIVPLKLGGYALLAEGVRQNITLDFLRNRYLPKLDRKLKRLENPYLNAEKLGLSPREQRAVDLVDGERSVRDLLVMGGSDRQTFETSVYQALYLLEELEMLEIV